MQLLKSILVPVDYSGRCSWAVRYGIQLAGALQAKIHVIHVAASPDPEALDEFLGAEAAKTRLDRSVLLGDPAEQIVCFARREAFDLILMPTHGHGRFRRFLLGSVTAKVLDDADCPVWTGVHQPEGGQPASARIQRVICGVEPEPRSIPLIRWAQDLCARFGATLTVVHAIPAADEISENRGEVELRRYLFGRAEADFERLRQVSGLDVPVVLAGGDAGRTLREAALRENADLMVIGRGQIQRPLGRLRTQAYSIIRQSPCPVVSV